MKKGNEQQTAKLMSEEDLMRSLSVLEQLAAGADESLIKSDRSSGEKEQGGSEDEDETDDDAQDPDNDEDDAQGPDNDEDDEGLQKSIQQELLGGSEPMRKAIEVSEFLEGLVEGVSNVLANRIGRLEKSFATLAATQKVTNEVLAKSMKGVVDQMRGDREELKKSFATFGSAPVSGRKSFANATVLEKSFVGNDGTAGKYESLTKSQKAEMLSDLLIKGQPGIQAADVVNVETTGIIPPHLEEVLRKAL